MIKFANSQIKAEYNRLHSYFEGIEQNQLAIAEPLMANSAFMKVTLEEMQKSIAESGVVDEYQNGENQKGLKQSAAIQAYNSLIKNYASVTKMLFALLPKSVSESRLQAFMAEVDE